MTPLVTIHDDDLLPPLVRVLGAEVGFDLLRIGIDDGAFVIERAPLPAHVRSELVSFQFTSDLPDDAEPIDLWPVAEPQTDPELVDHEILDMLDGKDLIYAEIEMGVADVLGPAAADKIGRAHV